MKKSITVVIGTDGTSVVEAHNYVGGACKVATAPLMDTLIGDPAAERVKPEFYDQEGGKKVKEFE